MSVILEAIKFNFDPTSASNDAINIRRNATSWVEVPEWRRGVSVKPEDSVAAYSIKETLGNAIRIQANLQIKGAKGPLWVRAIDATVTPSGSGCLGLLIAILSAIIRLLAGNVLGDVKARKVSPGPGGTTGFVSFKLVHVRLSSAGVGARTTEWRWQYASRRMGPWTDFETTRHRIYSIVEVPHEPWTQTPYLPSNTNLPWTDVMDFACQWAVLATDRDTAAAAVARSVYALGPSRVEYDCPGGGASHYSGGLFDCTAFVERLRGGPGRGKYVNCSDCATFVSTFANVLGCDLWQSRMEFSFELNEILAIGSSTWQTACGWGSFSYHEVAWKGACTSNDNIYDGCLQVDGDANPLAPPHTALLPINMRFGLTGDGDYRDRLCTVSGRANCNPQPSTRTRRAVY